MKLKQMWLDWIHDDKKEAELASREEATDEKVKALREHRNANGFGRMFDVAIHPREKRP